MSGYDILVYIIIPIGVTILTTAIIALTKLVSTKLISNRLIVKEITKISDKDINQFIDLYNKRISSDIRICAEQIVDFSSFGGNTDIKHHLYVCKDKDNVVAFVKLMTSTSKKYVFIAYIAIDDTDLLAIRSGVNLLINHTIKKHIKKENNIQLFTEIERGSQNGYITRLSKVIARRSREFGYNAYFLKFDYIQPNMPDENYNNVNEHVLSLIWIPINKPKRNYLLKKEVIDICRNLYFDIYYPSCDCTNCCDSYRAYLEKILKLYEKNLPKRIEIESLN
jgi:hypothetical protein